MKHWGRRIYQVSFPADGSSRTLYLTADTLCNWVHKTSVAKYAYGLTPWLRESDPTSRRVHGLRHERATVTAGPYPSPREESLSGAAKRFSASLRFARRPPRRPVSSLFGKSGFSLLWVPWAPNPKPIPRTYMVICFFVLFSRNTPHRGRTRSTNAELIC